MQAGRWRRRAPSLESTLRVLDKRVQRLLDIVSPRWRSHSAVDLGGQVGAVTYGPARCCIQCTRLARRATWPSSAPV